MSFSDIRFVFIFLPVFIILYRFLPARCQKCLLALGGVIFYAWGQKYLVFALLISCLINYLLHLAITGAQKKIPLMVITILVNAGLLLFCKVTGQLPLGISFYTFQVIALQVDSRDDRLNLMDFLAMLLCFPKLAMGPIADTAEMKKALSDSNEKHLMNAENMEEGLRLFTLGLALKVVFADNLASLWNSIRVTGAAGITTSVAILGAVTYSLELYLDFYGYSLMAYGLGKIAGFPIPMNFDEPYSSVSISEFWRRWNVTLGKWFKNYIYIPMGGNRKGRFRMVINLIAVWLLTGLWHGFGINFLIWSMFLFCFIVIEKITPLGSFFKENKAGRIIGRIYTVVVVILSWVIFAITSTQELWIYLKCMFGIHQQGIIPASGQFARYINEYRYLLLGGILACTPLPKMFWKRFGKRHWFILILIPLFMLCLKFMLKGSNVFMYYSF